MFLFITQCAGRHFRTNLKSQYNGPPTFSRWAGSIVKNIFFRFGSGTRRKVKTWVLFGVLSLSNGPSHYFSAHSRPWPLLTRLAGSGVIRKLPVDRIRFSCLVNRFQTKIQPLIHANYQQERFWQSNSRHLKLKLQSGGVRMIFHFPEALSSATVSSLGWTDL